MKPLYWKFLLILGAMIVGASLAVPKALRKNTAHGVDNVSQTLLLTGLSQSTVLGAETSHDVDAVITVDIVKCLPALYTTNFSKLSFAMAIRYVAEENTFSHPLSAGTRPTKSRVIDRYFVSV